MKFLRPLNKQGYAFDHIIATGGIGGGIFMALEGNHNLGRNESRMARLLPCRDFCKQHIILHYLSVLLGAGNDSGFQVFPIGKVGADDTGKDCIARMNAVGMILSGVSVEENLPTLFSLCFQYPDGSGGNITTVESASYEVHPIDIENFFNQYKSTSGKEIILAVPEVPLETRIRLLEVGRSRGSFNVVSIQSSEADAFHNLNGFVLTDLISINIDEARSIAGLAGSVEDSHHIVNACIKRLTQINPSMVILVTDGAKGNYSYGNEHVHFTPALKVDVASTAGAGDSFLSGVLSGLSCGLPLMKTHNDNFFGESELNSAVELGTLLAALSVTSWDTIHAGANAALLYEFAKQNNVELAREVQELIS